MKKLMRILWNTEGQSLIEYVFIVSLIAITAIIALTEVGTSLEGILDAAGSAL